jgi:hypothetical protein
MREGPLRATWSDQVKRDLTVPARSSLGNDGRDDADLFALRNTLPFVGAHQASIVRVRSPLSLE